MKNYITIALLIFCFAGLFAETLTVGPGYQYSTIALAIAAADNFDNIAVYGSGTYGAINLGNLYLRIYAVTPGAPTISGSNNVVNMGSASNSWIDGFKITGSSSATGVYSVDNDGIKIKNCTIYNVDIGVYIEDCDNFTIELCTIRDNDEGIYIYDTNTIDCDADLKSTKLYSNTKAIYIDGCYSLEVTSCLFYDNGSTFDMSNRTVEALVDRTTISDNDNGFEWGTYAYFDITNSIVYENTTNFSGTPADLDIYYSCIEGGYTGTGNIDDDPNFCFEYYYEYHLMEGSPCIDTGVPSATGGDVRIDMGCFETTRDIKECTGNQWNYVSFPRLYRTGNASVDVVPLLENFLDWDFHLEMLYDVIFFIDPTLEYDDVQIEWDPDSLYVKSSLGYKLDPDDAGVHYLPTVTSATRLADDWELTYTLDEGDDCWMGYWLPYTQNIEDAFGDFFDDLVSVSAEDWYYEYSRDETPSSITTNKNMVYGKGYVVVFETDIEGFYWTDATERSLRGGGGSRPEPQYFTFDDLPSYEAIDVMDIPDNVVEIGVYEGETCIGAVVVQDTDEQILAYSTNANRNYIPLTFEVITNNRQSHQLVSNYFVKDKESGRWVNRPLISGQQRSSVIMFGNLEDPQNNTPGLDKVILHGNYPNPFNPETNISFSLPSEQNIELIVYNMKGQKIRQLVSGQFASGEHSVTWDGKDNEGKNVGSGLYLYKLKTNDQVFSKKMLLLK